MYSKEQKEKIFNDVINKITEGRSVNSILKEKGMPDYVTFIAWIEKDEQKLKKYVRAKEESADSDADNIQSIAERVLSGEVEPNAARVAIDAYKWTAGKKKPKKYGDSSVLDIKSGDSTIETFKVTFAK